MWRCGSWGRRVTPSPDHSNCSALPSLQSHLTSLLEQRHQPVTVLEQLNHDITEHAGDNLATGDIETVVTLLETATDLQINNEQAEHENDSETFVSMSVRTVNSLGRA